MFPCQTFLPASFVFPLPLLSSPPSLYIVSGVPSHMQDAEIWAHRVYPDHGYTHIRSPAGEGTNGVISVCATCTALAEGGLTPFSLFGGSAFFSGKPNFAARLASTSSESPNEVLSIAPAFSFFSFGSATPLPLLLFSAVVVLAGAEDLADAEAEGSNGRPNRSARALRACCSGVSSAGAVGVDVDGAVLDWVSLWYFQQGAWV